MRKQLQAEDGKADIEKKIEQLEARYKKQCDKVIELHQKIEAIAMRNSDNQQVD